MKGLFTQSEHISHEYCCSVVKIGEITPVENSDFLAKTIVDGFQIVVRKDQVKPGDYMFYAANETELDSEFLSKNNLYELGEYYRNSNASEVDSFLDILNNENKLTKEEREELTNTIDRMHGFFNKNGRVKMIKLRKCPSMGYLFTLEELANAYPVVKDFNMEEFYNNNSDRDFDTIDGKLFIKAYVPHKDVKTINSSKTEDAKKRLKKFNRLIENQFVFHYDTQQLNKNMWKFTPETEVDISVKRHGTSAIFSNCLVKKEKEYPFKFFTWINKHLPLRLRKYVEDYDLVYSSRTVIKNQYINEKVSEGFYGTDIWGEYAELLRGKIPSGTTIYGEIIGYLTGSESMIQKNYDYGCNIGENKLMIYRVTNNHDGKIEELDIEDVNMFTETLLTHYPELKEKIVKLDMLYSGKLSDLHPEITIDEHWSDNILESLKTEKRFLMEETEPLCKNKVPREGIVIRIKNDPMKEAFKLKCSKFLEMEGKLIDSGEVDMEMQAGYGDTTNEN